MPPIASRYTVMMVPENGLFYFAGQFIDGAGKEVKWDRTIHIFRSRPDADKACRALKRKWGHLPVSFVALRVKLRGQHEAE